MQVKLDSILKRAIKLEKKYNKKRMKEKKRLDREVRKSVKVFIRDK
jgi:hypothetical protein